jgi:hypothetical protein
MNVHEGDYGKRGINGVAKKPKYNVWNLIDAIVRYQAEK